MKRCSIGIPRALLYHKYEWLWRTFFEQLGCDVVISPETNRRILDDGLALAVDESCLPLKILLGHVAELRGTVDYVFIPTVESLTAGEEVCSKFFGLYDIVHNTFPEVPLLGCRIDAYHHHYEQGEFLKLGRALCRNPLKVRAAYRKAREVQRARDAERFARQEARLRSSHGEGDPDRLTLLIVAHPYTVRDRFFGQPIVDFLRREKVHILFSDSVDHEEARERSSRLSRDVYWTYSKELLGAVDKHKDDVDGILYVMCFPCGPDSLTVELAQRKVKEKPSLVLTLDELQGEIGLVTRLESFTDILRRKRQKDIRAHA